MAAKRILLFGAQGQIGQALRRQPLPDDWELAAYDRAACDMTDYCAVQKVVHAFKPDLVINTAAMTAVDQCEKEPDQAMSVNFQAPANLAAQCAAIAAPLIHLSTDYVFDGQGGGKPYGTHDPMNPVNVYGQSKMLGEEAVRHESPWHVILRISSVFGAFGNNLLTKTLAMIDKHDMIKVVTDQQVCPTYAPDAARAIVIMADAILRGKTDGLGTFHLCGTPAVTRFDFTQAVMDVYAHYTLRRPKILPALSADFPEFVPRPAYSVLDCNRILDVYGIAQNPWREGLKDALLNLDHKTYDDQVMR